MARVPPTTADGASSLSSEREVRKQDAKTGLRTTDNNQSVVTTVISGGDTMQRTLSIAGHKRNRSFNLFASIDTAYTSSRRFVSDGKYGKFANVDVPIQRALTTVPTLIPFMDLSVTWRGKCVATLCVKDNWEFVMNSTACYENGTPSINFSKSLIVTVVAECCGRYYTGSGKFTIASQRNHYINFTIGQVSSDFRGEVNFKVRLKDEIKNVWVTKHVQSWMLKLSKRIFYFYTSSPMTVHYEIQKCKPSEVVTLYVSIEKGTFVRDLPVVMLSDTSGYLTSPGFRDNQKYPDNYDGVFDFEIASNSSLLISIVSCKLQPYKIFRSDFLEVIFLRDATHGAFLCCREEEVGFKLFKIYCRSIIVFRESIRIYFHTDTANRYMGFKMMFTILPKSLEPKRLGKSVFNCSVPSFHHFSPVFNCNNVMECAGGEDCAQQNNGCGTENPPHSTKCFSFFLRGPFLTWFDAQKECRRRNLTLATFENPDELKKFEDIALHGHWFLSCFIGAQRRQRPKAVSTLSLYSNIWQWVDGRTVFSVPIQNLKGEEYNCALYKRQNFVIAALCGLRDKYSFITSQSFACEFRTHGESLKSLLGNLDSDVFQNITGNFPRVSIIQCPSDQVTRDFLFCDPQADCDVSNSVTSCRTGDVTVPMFACQRSQSVLHYTLVCDHMQHCPDNADEDFCQYPECPPTFIKCRNDQCIRSYQENDGKFDCYDGSDELSLPRVYFYKKSGPPPGIIYLDGRGNFWVKQMNHSDVCPPTHFLCPRSFCLPVYLRCNGIVDCMGREDEVGCDIYKCRGFYRCRGSKICLHADNICDSVPQCPEQDDEWLCNVTCPYDCRCQGLAFVCASIISAASHLTPRYLDVSGSNMTISDIRNNFHLIVLRLSMCGIVNLPIGMSFPNLRELDISWNKLHRLHMDRLLPLKNLVVLVLTGNPLIKITNSKLSESAITTLERVDLSHTSLKEFSGSEFSSSPNIKVLNISWTKLRSVAEDGFRISPRLESLDMRGFRLANISKNLLRHLSFLKIVHAENHKLCCEAMLPIHFDLKNCYTSYDLLASCDDLLKSNTYRVFMWIFAALSLVGNAFSIGARLYQSRKGGALSSFGVFVINLSMADLFMGVYLAIVGTADIAFRGRYLWHDEEWKKSLGCNIAGFFCLLSSETSAFIICIITLDRFIVLRFPFGRLHFGRRSAVVVSGVTWAVGISLAILPLLPVTSQWEFYSQTGICIPLPFTSSDHFRGYHYSFGVSILLNLVLFLLIAMGQVVVYWSVRANSIASSTNTQSRDTAIARRLITVVVSDFLCWFPIGLLGLLASTGTPIPGDLNVAVATLVLPVNSALNPFLYTFNLVMERRRKVRYEQLLKRLELERRDQTPAILGKIRKIPESVNKDVAIQQIQAWIGEQVLTAEDLLSCSPPVSVLKIS